MFYQHHFHNFRILTVIDILIIFLKNGIIRMTGEGVEADKDNEQLEAEEHFVVVM